MEFNIHSILKNPENRNNHQSNNFSNFQYFLESSLKLSEIEYKGNEQTKKFDSINSYNFESISNCNQTDKQKIKIKSVKKKLTKEDLNNIPLPIFSCIYCSNENVAFDHLIKENIYNKYFLQTSVYDIKKLDRVIKINPIIDRYNQNPPLISIIVKNTEFIKHCFIKNAIYNFFSSEIFKKISEVNSIKITKNFLQKLEDKYIRKRNKELSNNKCNSNKLFIFDENKISFHKQNNNSTFTNDNLTTNKNSTTNTNTIGPGSSPIIGLSSSLNNNNENINNINICFNQNNMMQSIMEKIENNEESDGETEEKFLDILEERNNSTHKIDKNNISFEEKYYDIWNPDITVIKEEEDNNNNINYNIFSSRNRKHIKRIINFINKKKNKNIFNINNIKNNNKDENIINYNKENKINKKIIYKRNIFSPFINNNIKKRNLMEFINYKNRRNLNIDPLLHKHKFFTKDNNNYNNKLNIINNLISKKTKDSYNNTVSQQKQPHKIKKNLLHLLKSKSGLNMYRSKNNNININSSRLIRKASLSSTDNLSHTIKKNNHTFTNLHEQNLNSFNSKSIKLNNDIYQKKNYDINLDIDINNKKMDILSKYLKISNRSLLSSSLKERSDLTSFPNLKINLSPIYNYKFKGNKIKMNPNKKIRIKNNLRKINSYNFLQNRCVSLSRPAIKLGIFSIK